MNALQVNLLGNFKIECDKKPVEKLSQPRLQSLFAYLILHRNAPIPRRELASLFWLNSTEAQARANLRKLLFDLRRAFPEIEHFVQTDSQAIQWKRKSHWTLDVDQFKEAAAQAFSVEELKSATSLYTGDLLIDCYDDWVTPEREQLRLLFLETLERLINKLEAQHEYTEVLQYAELLLQYDLLNEETYRKMMRLFASRGNRAGVVQAYHACVSAFQRELNMEPSQATRDAYKRYVNLDSRTVLLPEVPPHLSGRRREWNQLKAAWNLAQMGQPQWVILTGKEGVGKTRLAEELIQWANSLGIKTTSSRCYAAEMELPYAPVKAFLRAHTLPHINRLWLTELARLMPELLVKVPGLAEPGPISESWQRHRFFDALSKAILAEQPVLLFMDDLQWCDKGTFEWIQSLFHFESQGRFMLVSTFCLDKMCPEYPLASLWPDLQRSAHLIQIEVPPLSQSETANLVANALGKEYDTSLVSQIYQETGGNPFKILNLARKGIEKSPVKSGLRHSLTKRSLRLNLPGIHWLNKS